MMLLEIGGRSSKPPEDYKGLQDYTSSTRTSNRDRKRKGTERWQSRVRRTVPNRAVRGVPNRTGYRTVPVRNRYGSASKNGPGSRIVQKILNRTGTVRYGTVPVSFVLFGSGSVRFGSNNVVRRDIFFFQFDEARYGTVWIVPYHTGQ